MDLGRHVVLVVDDEAGIRRGCERVLRARGHEVLLAEDGERGLALLRQHPETELALVDLRMPGMSGLEFIARAREAAPETVLAVITGYGTLEAAVEATKRGAYDFVSKPLAADELVRLVDRALERARLIRERNHLEAERRRRMLELATEQSRLRTIIDCMADGVLVCNAQQELVLYNPAALEVLSRLPASREPRPVSEVVACVELVQMIAEAAGQPKRLSCEIRLATPPPEQWVLADVAPVVDQDSGRFLGAVTVLRDITALERVEQVKAQFVNMVAHELRAPLSAVDSYLSALLEGFVPDAETRRRILERSQRRVQALLDLVGDLLDVARMEAGAVRREIMPQQMADVVREVVQTLQPLAEAGRVRVEAQVPDGLPPVEADREELIRLFGNLLSNAIKCNRPDGRVLISAEDDARGLPSCRGL